MQAILAENLNLVSGGPSISFVMSWNAMLDNDFKDLSSFSIKADGVLSILKASKASIKGESQVGTFLIEHPGIIYYLPQLYKLIEEKFGSVNTVVELFSDPDGNSTIQELFVEIFVAMPPKEANEKNREIIQWLIGIEDQDVSSLNTSLRFI